MEQLPDLVHMDELITRYRTNRNTLMRLVAKGKLPSPIRFGRYEIYFRIDEVLEAERRMREPTEKDIQNGAEPPVLLAKPSLVPRRRAE